MPTIKTVDAARQGTEMGYVRRILANSLVLACAVGAGLIYFA
ncbi:MAG: hypothetical protein AAFO79_02630 [Pseudomonadota bacterium]